MRKPSWLYLLIPLLMPCLPALAQEQEEVILQPVRSHVYMLQGNGGNIGLSAGEDGVFMIDDQYAPVTPAIRKAIAGISEQPVRFLVNTHWHQDHTGGNENFGKAGAIIVAHDNVRSRLSSEQFIEAFKRKVPASPDAALPVVTFSDSVSFHINGDHLRAFHVPHGHTDGDSVINFTQANVIHTGDIFFNGKYPFIDLSSGGSINGMIAAVERILEIADRDTKIIPGHGSLSDRQGLAAYQAMLVAIRDRISKLVDAGKSLEQVQAARPTAAYDAQWGQGFIKPEAFVATVYQSLESNGD